MPKRRPHSLLGIVDVDADDLVSAHHPRALDDVEPDAAEAKHHDVGARRDFGGVDHGAHASCHAAADIAALVERRVLTNLGDSDLRQHREIGKGRAAHVVENRVAFVAEARGTVGHQALALRGADRRAEIGLLTETAFALPAFRRVQRDHVIAWLDRGDAGSHLAHDASAFMAQDRRENSFAVESIQRIGVSVTDSRRLDLDQDLTRFRAFQIEFDDFERLLGFKSNRGARFH